MCASRQSAHRGAPTLRCAPQYLLRHSKAVIRENTMRSTFIKRQPVLAVACALALGVFSATAGAQRMDPNEKALLLDTRGAPVMSSGLCWHTAYGPAPLWTAGCHAERPAPVAWYVAPAAEPRPAPAVVAAAAPLAVYEKVAFDANVLFDSNKSVLRPADRDSLDAFVSNIGGLDTQSVTAIGYADRRGTDASNQILSEERVAAVKAYLVSKGVSADRVKTSAWGETRPSTAAAECKDANNAKNVACMQPDRHVSIEISGSRLAK
jgi:OOP family OmpA-OmpF porin